MFRVRPKQKHIHIIFKILKDFESEFSDALPTILKRWCASFENKHNFEGGLMDNSAIFHKVCTQAYNKSKLAQKRKWKEIDQNDENEKMKTQMKLS